ncbi:MAG: A24 family peptidase [Anaerovibrio sp.]|uniref:prepilin peptidase n=1 Tax=Anaerovibrio sp. TaxID=1872532 RepID=UPI0025F86E75|nr:A24 family peptidase [Anaerovibrio sp.]MCR5177288.1 A24 family peptidase [Anaerovibrio sp.]
MAVSEYGLVSILKSNQRMVLLWWISVTVPEIYMTGDLQQPFKLAVFNLLIIGCGVLDYYYGRLFNQLTALTGFTGLIFSCYGQGAALGLCLEGSLVFGGILFVLRVVSRNGLGAGDVKFGFALGIWLGPEASLAAVYIAFVTGGIYGLFYLWYKGIHLWQAGMITIPFGPFMALGGSAGMIWGKDALAAWLSLLQI